MVDQRLSRPTFGRYVKRKRAKGRPKPKAYLFELKRLEKTHPHMVSALKEAHTNRQQRLARYATGLRLAGYEELVSHLQQLDVCYSIAHNS